MDLQPPGAIEQARSNFPSRIEYWKLSDWLTGQWDFGGKST